MADKTKHQRKRYAAEFKFSKIAALDGLVVQGGEFSKDGRKAKKQLSESWMRRSGTNVTGFHKRTAPGAVTIRTAA